MQKLIFVMLHIYLWIVLQNFLFVFLLKRATIISPVSAVLSDDCFAYWVVFVLTRGPIFSLIFREKGREKYLPGAPTGDGTCNLDMCPDLELNLQPFGVLDNTPTNWPIRPQLVCLYFKVIYMLWDLPMLLTDL